MLARASAQCTFRNSGEMHGPLAALGMQAAARSRLTAPTHTSTSARPSLINITQLPVIAGDGLVSPQIIAEAGGLLIH
jgi:hypothetical protein